MLKAKPRNANARWVQRSTVVAQSTVLFKFGSEHEVPVNANHTRLPATAMPGYSPGVCPLNRAPHIAGWPEGIGIAKF
jgi:hypothetical protein